MLDHWHARVLRQICIYCQHIASSCSAIRIQLSYSSTYPMCVKRQMFAYLLEVHTFLSTLSSLAPCSTSTFTAATWFSFIALKTGVQSCNDRPQVISLCWPAHLQVILFLNGKSCPCWQNGTGMSNFKTPSILVHIQVTAEGCHHNFGNFSSCFSR